MNLHTRKDFEDCLLGIVNPLLSRYSRKGACLNLAGASALYEDISIQMEGFSRVLWGLVPFWAGGGSNEVFEEIYRRGLLAGTDPMSEEYWGTCHDKDQRFVEMAAIAYGILLSPNQMWDIYSAVEKNRIAAWLNQINEHEVVDNNWHFFRILVNAALKKENMPYDSRKLEEDFQRIEDFYEENGWYHDGADKQKDYYISFAFHFYGLLYAAVFPQEERSGRYKDRAMLFAEEFVYWFDNNGEALPYGRSMAYRFAQVSFFSGCLLAGIKPFSLGVMKGIIVRNLERWLEYPVFDNGGVLTVGYHYPNIHMAEHYNSPTSPYWGLKAFALLALNENDEFWQTEPEALPCQDGIYYLEGAQMMVGRKEGHVTAYVLGNKTNFSSGQIPAKYLKFAYSSLFGFSVPRSNVSLEEAAPDSSLCFVYDGMVLYRRSHGLCEYKGKEVHMVWSPMTGIEVESVIVPTDFGHIRRHTITTSLECDAYDCGFSVGNMDHQQCRWEWDQNSSMVQNSSVQCRIESRDDWEGTVITPSPNTSLYFGKTKIPAVKKHLNPGKTICETWIYESESK